MLHFLGPIVQVVDTSRMKCPSLVVSVATRTQWSLSGCTSITVCRGRNVCRGRAAVTRRGLSFDLTVNLVEAVPPRSVTLQPFFQSGINGSRSLKSVTVIHTPFREVFESPFLGRRETGTRFSPNSVMTFRGGKTGMISETGKFSLGRQQLLLHLLELCRRSTGPVCSEISGKLCVEL